MPTKDNNLNLSFLSIVAKKIHVYDDRVINSIKESLESESFYYLKPKIIYTLKNYNKPIIFTTKSYQEHLKNISNELTKEIRLLKL